MGNRDGEVFVGRKAELDGFLEVLESAQGQAVVVAGPAGMGKTWLVNRMAYLAEEHTSLKVWSVRYETAPTDGVDTVMLRMMTDAEDAVKSIADNMRGYLKANKDKLAALLEGVGGLVLGKRFEVLCKLVVSLSERARSGGSGGVREQFIEMLEGVSASLADDARLVFIIDPEKYMPADSDQAWAIVVRRLPAKVKFVFAQRDEDVLVNSNLFCSLGNVAAIPEKKLKRLEDEAVRQLVEARAGEVEMGADELGEIVAKYDGHPYALQGAIDLLKAGVAVDDLPTDPTDEKIAAAQWKEICKRGTDGQKLFDAMAVLEVACDEDVLEYVSGVGAEEKATVLADNFMGGYTRVEAGRLRIYHAILADHMLGVLSDAKKKAYHKKAVEIYRGKLNEAKEKQVKPDEVAAVRLCEHVLVVDGEDAFVAAFRNECYSSLRILGLLETAVNYSLRALVMVQEGSKEEARLCCCLGSVYTTQGNLGMAVEVHSKALDICEQLGWLEGKASQYGNLGNVYRTQGDLDKAVEMYDKALKIDEQFGRLEGMAKSYGNLGCVYTIQGDYDKALEMHDKAIKIDEQLGLVEGMANQYCCLGGVYQTQGDLGKAVEMYEKALKIDEQLGRVEGMANLYSNLGVVYYTRGDLDKAVEMYEKAIKIYKQIGKLEGMAFQYANLGNVCRIRGEKEKAIEYWEKAKGFFSQMGVENEVVKVQGWIDGINR